MNRYRSLLLIILVLTLIVLRYAADFFLLNVLDAPWLSSGPLAASLAVISICVAGLRRARPSHRVVLLVGLMALIVLLVPYLCIVRELLTARPLPAGELRQLRLRGVLLCACLIAYGGALYPLYRSGHWIAPRRCTGGGGR